MSCRSNPSHCSGIQAFTLQLKLLQWLLFFWVGLSLEVHTKQLATTLLNLLNQHPFGNQHFLSIAKQLFSSGNGSVPRNSICSQKCASPGISSGSLKYPGARPHKDPLLKEVLIKLDKANLCQILSPPFKQRWTILSHTFRRMSDLRFLPTCTSRAAAARSAEVSEQQRTRKPFRSVEAL